jgi:hypothetical protein
MWLNITPNHRRTNLGIPGYTILRERNFLKLYEQYFVKLRYQRELFNGFHMACKPLMLIVII